MHPWLLLSAEEMDTVPAPDLLLRCADSPAGWATVRGVLNALETHAIKSLARPIEAWDGFDGASGWIIA
jgi:hypothetical protein